MMSIASRHPNWCCPVLPPSLPPLLLLPLLAGAALPLLAVLTLLLPLPALLRLRCWWGRAMTEAPTSGTRVGRPARLSSACVRRREMGSGMGDHAQGVSAAAERKRVRWPGLKQQGKLRLRKLQRGQARHALLPPVGQEALKGGRGEGGVADAVRGGFPRAIGGGGGGGGEGGGARGARRAWGGA